MRYTENKHREYTEEAQSAGNSPEKRFSTGAVSATVWKNQGVGKSGPVEFRTVSFQRSYKDKEDKWQHTSSLRLHDIPKATLVLNKAFEYLVMKESQQGTVEEEVI
jgi:hypothetical protein